MQVNDKYNTTNRSANGALNTEAFEYFKTLNELQVYLLVTQTIHSLTHSLTDCDSLTHSLTH